MFFRSPYFEHFIDSGFGNSRVWWALVAETQQPSGEAEVVGFALWYVRYSTWKGQRMYLEDILVTKKMRGMGIGSLLFDELLKECRKMNFSGIVWQVLDWNETALDFYKKYPKVIFDREWINCRIETS